MVRWLRLPLVVLFGLGFGAAPADAQLWKPTKKKPAATSKAKSGPSASRKVSKPTKRKARPKARKKAPRATDDAPKVSTDESAEFDDSPIITILPGDDE